MHVFVDESGKFESDIKSDFGVMVIVTITDKAYEEFKTYFVSLFGDRATKVKAVHMYDKERKRLLKYVGNHQEIKYSAFIYDHKSTSFDAIKIHQERQVKKIEEGIERIRSTAVYDSLIKDSELLRNQLRKLSPADYLKVISLIEALRDWAQTFTFDYFHTNVIRDSWNINHVFDMQNNAPTFIRLVYSLLSLSSNKLVPNVSPIKLPVEWKKDHPFFIKYKLPDGVNMKEFYKNIRCGNDEIDLGLKIPDLISNTIYRSIQRQNEKKWLKMLKLIWPNRSFVHNRRGQIDYYKITTFHSSTGYELFPSLKLARHFDAMKRL